MFSAIYFFNLRGDILIQRIYRDDIECVQCQSAGIRTAAQNMPDGDLSACSIAVGLCHRRSGPMC